jgi:serine/threonine-protein kinase
VKTFGRYQLLRRIASGGMAEVFLATGENPVNAELIAVKLIHAHIAQDESFMAMFLDEARLTAPLAHPNLVRIFDLGLEQSRLYLALAYIRGHPLHVVGQKTEGAGIGAARAAAVVEQAARGLHYAHEAHDSRGQLLNLVHRDVSPHNLLLDQEGVVKVVDFGVAKATGQLATSQKGGLKGKAGYSAPEQLRNEGLDRRADVYALGSVLFELACGEPLFPGKSEAEILQRMLFEPLRDLRVPNVPPALAKIIARCVSPKPVDRYASARELADVLADFAGNTGRAQLASLMASMFPPLPRTAEEALADESLPAIRSTAAMPTARPNSGSKAQARPAPEAAYTPPRAEEAATQARPALLPFGDDDDMHTQAAGPELGEATAVTSPHAQPLPRRVSVPLERTSPERPMPGELVPTRPEQKRPPGLVTDPGEDTRTTTTGASSSTHTETKPQAPPRRPGQPPRALVLGAGAGMAALVGFGAFLGVSGTPVQAPSHVAPAAVASALDAGPPPPVRAPEPPSIVAMVADAGPPPPDLTEPAPTPRRQTGMLTIYSSPWARVKLDGHDVGETPIIEKVVSAGRHKLELTNPDTHLRRSVTVVVAANRKNVQKVKLNP